MIELTRRLFLFGSAAAIAAAAAGLPPAPSNAVTRAASPSPYLHRRLLDLAVRGLRPSGNVITFELGRLGADKPLVIDSISDRWSFRRWFPPGYEIIATRDNVLTLNVKGIKFAPEEMTDAEVHLTCEDRFAEDGPWVLLGESHKFDFRYPDVPVASEAYAFTRENQQILKLYQGAAA